MEADALHSLSCMKWVNSDSFARRHVGVSLHFMQKYSEKRWRNGQTLVVSCYLQSGSATNGQRSLASKVSCSAQNVQVLQTESLPVTLDEAILLKEKSEEVEPYLDGRCVFLVGMMGSGKTTVGRKLAEVLDYTFFDCDTLIEQSVGGITVAEIFKLRGEDFFRDKETEVLQRLSSMQRLVVSTGGGAVVRPINWEYIHKGISAWLDVPLEALARRIAAVGTNSRPLLHGEGDAYTQALKLLSTLLEKRGKAYANASTRVSLESIADKLGYKDVCDVTPAAIALETLVQIESFLSK